MLATCANCTHGELGACSLGVALPAGDLLCGSYRITTAFRDEIVRRAYADIRGEIDLAIVKHKAERSALFAG